MKLVFKYDTCSMSTRIEYCYVSFNSTLAEALCYAEDVDTLSVCYAQMLIKEVYSMALKAQKAVVEYIAKLRYELQRHIEDNSAILRRERHREQLYDSAQRMKKTKHVVLPSAPKKAGAINGVLNNSNDPYFKRREAHAERYYVEVRSRNMQAEIAAVSAASGVSKDEAERAYRHLFIDKHELEGGYKHFDASYDIAMSWQRLREGKNVQPHDVTLLKHEALESECMAQGMTYQQAHDEAEKSYNYAKEANEFNARRGDGIR